MEVKPIKVNVLGGFAVERDGQRVDDSVGRTHKVWLLLAYLLYHNDRMISQSELVRLLWEDGEEKDNPQNAFRTTLHRARTWLNQLEPSLGSDLLIHKDGGYGISDRYKIEIDAFAFDRLCGEGGSAEDDDMCLDRLSEAIDLYEGDFLPKLSGNAWVQQTALRYQERYLQIVAQVLPMLEQAGCHREVIGICRKTLQIDNYSELAYRHLMASLLVLGDREEVMAVYEKMSKLFLADFGILPPEDLRALYYAAVKTSNVAALSMEQVVDQLRETDCLRGALFCDYDFFKIIHNSTARLLSRSGTAVHLALINVTGKDGQTLPKRSLDTAMENLQKEICGNLRRGDVVSCCSATQFIIMLHMANYENSCMVCERVIKVYRRQYPHSPVDLQYRVHAVEPSETAEPREV